MRTPAFFTPQSIADLEALQTYIEADSVQQAERFENSVGETVDDLCDFPESRELIRHRKLIHLNLRRAIIRGFPNHLMVYSYDGDKIVVERAFHGAQDWVKDLIALDF